MIPELTPDIVILGVEFSDDYEVIGIRYVESRNVAPQAWKEENATVSASLLKREDIADLIDTLQEWLDVGLLHIRTDGGNSG